MAFRDSTTASGNSSTPSVSAPAGVAADDIVIIAIGFDAAAAAVDSGDLPSGFTELAETDITADGHTGWVGWKRAGGSEPGTYTFGDLGATADWVCQAFAFSGRHLTNPPVVSTTNVQNTPQTSPITVSANGVTALDGDDLLWISVPDVTSSGAGNGHTAPTNYTEAEDAENAWANLSGAYRENVGAGATGTVSGTFALSQDTAGWAAWLIRIPLADAGPPGGDYLLENGTDRFLLEDSSGVLILEETEGGSQTLNFTGTITPAGSLLRTVTKPYTGSITPAGALLKTVMKPFTGTITPSGLFTALRTVLLSFTATITPAGALATLKAALKSFTGTITPAGALTKAASIVRGYTATITPAGALNRVASFAKAFSATITPSGLFARAVSRVRAYAGTITPAGAFIGFKVIVRNFVATITPAGAFIKLGIKGFLATIAPAGAFTKTASFVRVFAGTIEPAGALFKTMFKKFTATIAAVGAALVGLFGVADRVRVTVGDRLKTRATASDQQKTLAAVADRLKTPEGISDQAKTLLAVRDRIKTAVAVSDELGN